MADQKDNQTEPLGKKMPVKTMIVVVASLLIEGLAISAAFMFSGGPAAVKADGAIDGDLEQMDKLVEVLIVEDRFSNYKEGRLFYYDVKIFIVIRNKDKEQIEQKVKDMNATISEDIATIVRSAEPAHLMESTLSTLKRHLREALDARLGRDDQGESRIEDVVVTKFNKIRGDY